MQPTRRSAPTRPPRTPAVRGPKLPGLLRAIRIAELLYFPVTVFFLLGLPIPRLDRPGEVLSYVVIAAEAFAAVAVFIGLGRRRIWAWVLAMVLAAWVLTGIVRLGNVATLARQPGNGFLYWSLGLLAWTFIAQLVALGCSLAFIPRRRELA
jgi:hypothetical protein